jgi:hypothetical protein
MGFNPFSMGFSPFGFQGGIGFGGGSGFGNSLMGFNNSIFNSGIYGNPGFGWGGVGGGFGNIGFGGGGFGNFNPYLMQQQNMFICQQDQAMAQQQLAETYYRYQNVMSGGYGFGAPGMGYGANPYGQMGLGVNIGIGGSVFGP